MPRSSQNPNEPIVRVKVQECRGPNGLYFHVIISSSSLEQVELRSIQIPAPADALTWTRRRRQMYVANQLQIRGVID